MRLSDQLSGFERTSLLDLRTVFTFCKVFFLVAQRRKKLVKKNCRYYAFEADADKLLALSKQKMLTIV